MISGNKKILIVTLWDNANVGNRLQNYALQQVLTDMGNSVSTAVVDRHPEGIKTKTKLKVKKVLSLLGMEKYRKSLDEYYRRKQERAEREKIGSAFSDEYIPSREYVGRFQDAFKKDFSSYDFAVAGSDQIWHRWYRGDENELPYYGLTFLPKEKRIAYAGSFGFDEVPEDRVVQYTEILDGYSNISSREDSGVKIIKELTGRDAELVLDPTLLLKDEQWMAVEKPSSNTPNHPYVLVYALGAKSDSFKDEINKLTSENGLEVIELRGEKKYGEEVEADPSEFVYLIHHAEIVLTDSFHATVFSLLFHKDVKVFRRDGEDMSSRIVSLAKVYGFESRLNKGDIIFSIDHNLNFEEAESKLNLKRKTSYEFLRNALQNGGA